MKYHSIITSALTLLCLLTSNSSLATQSSKKSSAEQARWFEIEVILFKHLSSSSAKNSDNIEQFSASDLSVKKRRALDLLAPYLQPNIASLKQLLPNCEQPETSLPYNINPSILWAEKLDNESNDADSSSTDNSSVQANSEESNSSTNMSVTVLSAPSNEITIENVAATEKAMNEESLTEKNDQTYTSTIEPAIVLAVYNQYPISSNTPLCVIPAEFFQQHLTADQLEQFNIDGFPVEKITKTINGLEQWQDDDDGEITWASDSPYLISQDSLRLKSISNRIKRSRNYAPLLHLGWRQTGDTKRQAKAIQLYTGDHLALGYQQAIATQKLEQKMLEVQAILAKRQQAEILSHSQITLDGTETAQITVNVTPTINSDNTTEFATDKVSNNSGMSISQNGSSDLAIDNTEATIELSIAEQLRLQAKQQQLENIFQQFALLNHQSEKQENNTNGVGQNEEIVLNEENVQRIVAQLSSDITAKESQLNLQNTTDKQRDITEPTQPWSVDGLFKVHLKRNNYLYIESELNIVDSSPKLSNKANNTASQNKVISFKQDRRVITGEIHYFDHPHIGMIVQIRRFDPTKPANEAVSQAKK
ncbi:hypothetical protein CXF85_17260 [Colwellia sp. 75C3]|uniref:CsiV family protein n=1 Tax=Colwellia sp. 75C3 TaxID=888425 RepID=UPI000C34B3FB|nr:CsiV family protein [Colwellia sp. 75C3]PKG81721.1 hypothetical protein CXF85_17260 [Colwellia sp. 75C3]